MKDTDKKYNKSIFEGIHKRNIWAVFCLIIYVMMWTFKKRLGIPVFIFAEICYLKTELFRLVMIDRGTQTISPQGWGILTFCVTNNITLIKV